MCQQWNSSNELFFFHDYSLLLYHLNSFSKEQFIKENKVESIKIGLCTFAQVMKESYLKANLHI